MEWVETTGRTTEEAKDHALDQLGVDESDAEFEILEEPRPGLFGRIRGEARVRARVRPTAPRPKAERRDRRDRRRKDEPRSRHASPAATARTDRPRPKRPRRRQHRARSRMPSRRQRDPIEDPIPRRRP